LRPLDVAVTPSDLSGCGAGADQPVGGEVGSDDDVDDDDDVDVGGPVGSGPRVSNQGGVTEGEGRGAEPYADGVAPRGAPPSHVGLPVVWSVVAAPSVLEPPHTGAGPVGGAIGMEPAS
jgi:hypothetical protein